MTAASAPSRRSAPDFLTVHGDPHVVRAAVAGRGDGPTRILAVTVLTSLDRDDLDEALIAPGEVADIVVERARAPSRPVPTASSPRPARPAAFAPCPRPPASLIVTPGIRPAGSATGDQKRIATPAAALAAGADHSSSPARS